MKTSLAALFAVLTAGVALGADPKTHPKTVLIIRHAEKPTDDGNPDLSPEGKKRAKALPELFEKSATRPDPFPTPDYIFAARASDESNRPVETVKHLSKRLKLDVNSEYKDKAFAKLVEELYSNPKYDGKTVLICWHHGTIPELATALGATGGPEKIKGSVFDRVWVVTFNERGKAKLVIRPQALLPDDAKE
jgi:broad specificity phosphatase PhoE